jgi:hypothetical protein
MNWLWRRWRFWNAIRNQGTDVLYLPEPKILHLKAPGKMTLGQTMAWENDEFNQTFS